MPTIKLFPDLSDLAMSQSQDVTITNETLILTDYGLKRYTFGGLRAYVFDSHLTDGAPFALTPMYIPAYFDQIPPDPNDRIKRPIQGMFALRLGQDEAEGTGFMEDKGHGRFGCPTRILLNTGQDYFTFNNMRFYPFLMTDLSIGYYVCDDRNDPRIVWPPYDATHEQGVSLDFPLSYDPTLGLYITRAASVVSSQTMAAVPSLVATPPSAATAVDVSNAA